MTTSARALGKNEKMGRMCEQFGRMCGVVDEIERRATGERFKETMSLLSSFVSPDYEGVCYYYIVVLLLSLSLLVLLLMFLIFLPFFLPLFQTNKQKIVGRAPSPTKKEKNHQKTFSLSPFPPPSPLSLFSPKWAHK